MEVSKLGRRFLSSAPKEPSLLFLAAPKSSSKARCLFVCLLAKVHASPAASAFSSDRLFAVMYHAGTGSGASLFSRFSATGSTTALAADPELTLIVSALVTLRGVG